MESISTLQDFLQNAFLDGDKGMKFKIIPLLDYCRIVPGRLDGFGVWSWFTTNDINVGISAS